MLSYERATYGFGKKLSWLVSKVFEMEDVNVLDWNVLGWWYFFWLANFSLKLFQVECFCSALELLFYYYYRLQFCFVDGLNGICAGSFFRLCGCCYSQGMKKVFVCNDHPDFPPTESPLKLITCYVLQVQRCSTYPPIPPNFGRRVQPDLGVRFNNQPLSMRCN